jgi:hypothetical protein
MSTFLQEDLIFYKNSDGAIMSGGYNVNSHMLQKGISPMQTFNLSQNGGTDNKVSSSFENLAVPVGLYYITQPKSKNDIYQQKYDKEHAPISDDIFDKLFEMIQYDNKNKRKTKKHNINAKVIKRKTKKYKNKIL